MDAVDLFRWGRGCEGGGGVVVVAMMVEMERSECKGILLFF